MPSATPRASPCRRSIGSRDESGITSACSAWSTESSRTASPTTSRRSVACSTSASPADGAGWPCSPIGRDAPRSSTSCTARLRSAPLDRSLFRTRRGARRDALRPRTTSSCRSPPWRRRRLCATGGRRVPRRTRSPPTWCSTTGTSAASPSPSHGTPSSWPRATASDRPSSSATATRSWTSSARSECGLGSGAGAGRGASPTVQPCPRSDGRTLAGSSPAPRSRATSTGRRR